MLTRRIDRRLLIAGAVWLMASSSGFATVIYVDVDATAGENDGTSWADAYTNLATAMSACDDSEDIWVAEGTYRGGWFGFGLTDGCKIYGGFNGTESSLLQRDPKVNETILSGDINNDDPIITDNANHVVTFGASITDATRLDGFTITAGYADGTGFEDEGGGMLVTTGYPTLVLLVFNYNHADSAGGALYIANSDLELDRCTFHDNDAAGGGAVLLSNADVKFSNSLFHHNSADGTSSGVGGAIQIALSDPVFANLTIMDNYAENDGGGINCAPFVAGSDPVLTNCILWNNEDDSGTNTEKANMRCSGPNTPVVTYTDWGDHSGGTGNIDSDCTWTAYHPHKDSDCVDSGLNSGSCGFQDLACGIRIQNFTVDMGAFEIQTRLEGEPH